MGTTFAMSAPENPSLSLAMWNQLIDKARPGARGRRGAGHQHDPGEALEVIANYWDSPVFKSTEASSD